MPVPMPTARLGRTDIQVSRICLGTMTWGHQNPQVEAFQQMDYALGEGVTFWDTAEVYSIPAREHLYGATETIIGNWFAQTKRRDEVFLASKISRRPWIRNNAPVAPDTIDSAIEDSLKRLQTDRIDLYQIHSTNRENYNFNRYFDFSPTPDSAEEGRLLAIVESFAKHIKKGNIRHWGVSNDTAWGVMKFIQLADKHNLPRPVTIQNEYSLLCRKFDVDLAEISLYENVGLLAYSPLGVGMLAGKYIDGTIPAGTRWSITDNNSDWRGTPQAFAAAKAYREVAAQHGLDGAQMALAFTLTKPFVTSTIIGATSMEQLKTNIAAAKVSLSQAVLADIQAVRKQFPIVY